MRRTRTRCAGAVLVCLVLLPGAPVAAAPAAPGPHRQADPGPAPDEEATVDPPPGTGLSRAVAALELTSPELDATTADLDSMRTRQRRATERLAVLDPELADLDVELGARSGVLERRDRQIAKSAEASTRAATAVRQIAVEWFISGFGALEGLDPALTSADRERLRHQFVLSEHAAHAALDDERVLEARVGSLRAERDVLAQELAERSERAGRLRREREQHVATLEEAARRLPELELLVDAAAMGADVEGTDLSAIALDAYWRADRALSVLDPACGIRWWVLAGIGRVESRHGTFGGSVLGTDGRVDPAIYGPDLDGSNRFAVVPDSDGGSLDGTAATDRATGPMQFLPGTWRMVGTDGDGDGEADPQNLFDAAVSAGVYLCRAGPDLGAQDRLDRALFTYNRDLSYVARVVDLGRQYLDRLALGG